MPLKSASCKTITPLGCVLGAPRQNDDAVYYPVFMRGYINIYCRHRFRRFDVKKKLILESKIAGFKNAT